MRMREISTTRWALVGVSAMGEMGGSYQWRLRNGAGVDNDPGASLSHPSLPCL